MIVRPPSAAVQRKAKETRPAAHTRRYPPLAVYYNVRSVGFVAKRTSSQGCSEWETVASLSVGMPATYETFRVGVFLHSFLPWPAFGGHFFSLLSEQLGKESSVLQAADLAARFRPLPLHRPTGACKLSLTAFPPHPVVFSHFPLPNTIRRHTPHKLPKNIFLESSLYSVPVGPLTATACGPAPTALLLSGRRVRGRRQGVRPRQP